MKSVLTLLGLAVILTLSGTARGNDQVEALIRQGDVFDQKLEAAEALTLYLAAEKLEPGNVPLLLRIARQFRHEAMDAPSREEKVRLNQLAIDSALRAVELAPDESIAHLSVAISYAKISAFLGTRDRIEASRKVKAAVERAIALDPRSDLAWHVLGRWHEQLVEIGPAKRLAARILYGEVPVGSSDEAVKCFLKAIQLNPVWASHYVELGIVYARMGKGAEARRYLEKGLAMPDVDKGDPEVKQRGRNVLASLK